MGKAAAGTEDFCLLPVGDKLMQYDRLAINTVASTRDSGIATCDLPVSTDLKQFDRDYRKLTGQVRGSGESYELGENDMVIGTSAKPQMPVVQGEERCDAKGSSGAHKGLADIILPLHSEQARGPAVSSHRFHSGGARRFG